MSNNLVTFEVLSENFNTLLSIKVEVPDGLNDTGKEFYIMGYLYDLLKSMDRFDDLYYQIKIVNVVEV